ncbi:MAG TPA: hypothetical protein VK495_00695 [Steroidobacteraceae bacterium]|nr:hypothetical protein [Steroidobacteraceae bacterium]
MTTVHPRRALSLLAPISLGAVALGSVHAAEPSVPMSALKKCADIVSIQERVTCYDQLAERPATGERAATAEQPGTAERAATPVAAAPKETFGLYSAEHPHPNVAKAAAVTLKIASIANGSSGHPIATMEGDQVWELDGPDPLLKSGDTVTIDRGVLGSFIMTTPAGRIHRLHRLR